VFLTENAGYDGFQRLQWIAPTPDRAVNPVFSSFASTIPRDIERGYPPGEYFITKPPELRKFVENQRAADRF